MSRVKRKQKLLYYPEESHAKWVRAAKKTTEGSLNMFIVKAADHAAKFKTKL